MDMNTEILNKLNRIEALLMRVLADEQDPITLNAGMPGTALQAPAAYTQGINPPDYAGAYVRNTNAGMSAAPSPDAVPHGQPQNSPEGGVYLGETTYPQPANSLPASASIVDDDEAAPAPNSDTSGEA